MLISTATYKHFANSQMVQACMKNELHAFVRTKCNKFFVFILLLVLIVSCMPGIDNVV